MRYIREPEKQSMEEALRDGIKYLSNQTVNKRGQTVYLMPDKYGKYEPTKTFTQHGMRIKLQD